MRKVFINKWFLLAVLLTLSLSGFSFVVYKKMQTTCTAIENGKIRSAGSQGTDMLWNVFSTQLSNFSPTR
jgi:hypothetical protein